MKFFFTLTRKGIALILLILIAAFSIGAWTLSAEYARIDGSTHENRMIYLRSLGFLPDEGNPGIKKIRLPDEFDAVYTRYNELQKKAGFDLSDFRGEDAVLYTYEINNTKQQIHLLTVDGNIVGGDIADVCFDGEMLPLKER